MTNVAQEVPTAEIPWVAPKLLLLARGNVPLRAPMLIVPESLQVVFAV